MLGFLKRGENSSAESQEQTAEESSQGLFQRLRKGLSRTRTQLGGGLSQLILGKKKIDDDLLDDIETLLLTADVGLEVSQQIIADLTQRLARKQLSEPEKLLLALREDLAAILAPCEQAMPSQGSDGPLVILMVGVNSVGKTTTIGKMAKRFQQEGKQVMLAAGDTFRAAAVEQLQVWGERNGIAVVAQQTGADSASVIYDAFESAKAKGVDVLIADTAGRLHTQGHLMEELKKVKRVIGKLDETAPHEVMMVLDAGTGQNGLQQAKLFDDAVGLTGLTVSKLDGTAKGGIIFAIAKNLGLPIRFIGVGEQIDDLRPFVAHEFVAALFDEDHL